MLPSLSRPGTGLFWGSVLSWLIAAAPGLARAQDSAPDPRSTTECLDANESSIELENNRQYLATRDKLRVCATARCPSEIRQECERRLGQINQTIPSVLFQFRDGEGNPVERVQLRRDGELQTAQSSEARIEADPGPHVFVFVAPGYATVRTRLELAEREQRRVERITFMERVPVSKPVPAVRNSGLHGQRLAAVILGGASLVAAGVGATFGMMAIHDDGQVDKACSQHFCSDASDTEKSKTAVTLGNLSTGFFVGAAAAAAGGLYLWLKAPADQRTANSLQLNLGPGSLGLWGTF